MSNAIKSFAAYTTIAVAVVAVPADASADGGRIAAGLLGGFAAGAIIGSAVAPRPYYAPAPVYVAPAPVYAEPQCYWTRGRAMWDGYRWVRPQVQVCD